MDIRRIILEQICRQFGISMLYAFGSQAKRLQGWIEGNEDHLSSSSDVDIGVKGAQGKNFPVSEKVSLTLTLEDFFKCQRVELIFLNEADPFLAAEIIRGERLFASNEHEADEYDLYILRRAGDLIPLEQERAALIMEKPL
jgi:predicted nucleotidyltransferase